MFLGRGDVGKSSLVRQIQGEKFEDNLQETPGIDIQPWSINCEHGDVWAHLWDFAGQEITHETHRFFLTQRSLYVVVIDGRGGQQMEEAEYWLRHVEKYGSWHERVVDQISQQTVENKSPAIVVLNKWQTSGPYELEKSRLKREFPNIEIFVTTDCKTGHGISALTSAICDVVDKMPSVREPWPRSYFKVRAILDQLATEPDLDRRKHFLNWQSYRDICLSCGITDAQGQSSLAENLNALGFVLYYGNHDRLRDTRILNPNWAANGLFGIIRGVQRRPYEGKQGHLWADEMRATLKEGMIGMSDKRGASFADYPEEKDGVKVYEFLLELMQDRELAFLAAFVDTKPLYLLPGLLTVDEPEPTVFDIQRHIDVSEVKFRYVYDLLPVGVMSRFIVRTHSLSEGCHRWQRGVVLAWKEAFALILAEPRRNPRIDVFIRGGTFQDQQELSGIIRSNMEDIDRGLPIGLRGRHELGLRYFGNQYESFQKLLSLEKRNRAVQIVNDESLQDVEVGGQLDQVQPSSARSVKGPRLKVFISYSHQDTKCWDRFRVHLDILKNEALIEWWFDGKIRAGQHWDTEIRNEINEADLVLLLVSNAFFSSSYIRGVEIEAVKKRLTTKTVRAIPVLLEPTPAFDSHDFLCELQAAPVVKGKLRPISSFNPSINGWSEVQSAIRLVVLEAREAYLQAEKIRLAHEEVMRQKAAKNARKRKSSNTERDEQ